MTTNKIEGLAELTRNLNELKDATSGKVLRSAAMASTTPVIRLMRAKAPRGDRAHRTYKGRLVAPGFLSRSIKRKSFISRKRGSVNVLVGLAKEAYYGLFYNQGFTRKTAKADTAVNKWRTFANTRRYRGWFSKTFETSRPLIENTLVTQLRRRIDKIRAKK